MRYIIIGTDHDLQRTDQQCTGLKTLLESFLSDGTVLLIAEEVATNTDVRTFGQQLIGREKWLSIDMSRQQKKDAGIYDIINSSKPERDEAGNDIRVNAYHRKAEAVRETFWLDRIETWCKERNAVDGTVIITCGHNHRHFLADKAARRGHIVTVEEYLPYDKASRFGRFWVYP